jgi:Fe-S cluster assembly ATP-binding protein
MVNALKVSSLHAKTGDGQQVIKGISFTIRPGEIHVVMGPNGAGKSSLALAMMGHPAYQTLMGKIMLGNKNLTKLSPDQRARAGLFLGFQYPVEVAGVNFASFLRMAVNANNQEKVSPIIFRRELSALATKLAFGYDMSTRSLNEGFSGGEKKKAEMLQLAVLKPKFAILDEPDSGLDVDALKYITKLINSMKPACGFLVITHYQKLLHYLKPDFVHILIGGEFVKSGSAEVAAEIENSGYERYQK